MKELFLEYEFTGEDLGQKDNLIYAELLDTVLSWKGIMLQTCGLRKKPEKYYVKLRFTGFDQEEGSLVSSVNKSLREIVEKLDFLYGFEYVTQE